MAKKLKKYPYDLKKQVVAMFLEGHSASELAEQFELGNRRRVYEWEKRVKEGGYEALNDHRGLRSQGKKKKEEKTLEEKYELACLEIEYLKKLLDLKRG